MGDYFPSDDQDQKAWIGQFLNSLTTYGTTLGLSAADVTALNTAGNNASGAITQYTGAEAAYEAALADRKTQVRTFTTVLRPLVRRMKTSGAYTPTIGQTLGVVSENTPVDPTLIKPSFSITVHMGFVRLRIRRNGATSVAVYCRRVGEMNWNLCSRVTRATFEDSEPLHTPGVPEVREYMVQGYLGDTAVGIMSDPKVVVYAGAIAA